MPMQDDLKAAMRQMPGAVALVTTWDAVEDQPAGLAATAVIPVTMEPPAMLVAINRSASAHQSIERTGRYCINLLGVTQTGFVDLFSNSSMREHRFASAEWAYREGLPYLPGACSSIFCDVREALTFGTHQIFIGEVAHIHLGDGHMADPLGWLGGKFARLTPLSS